MNFGDFLHHGFVHGQSTGGIHQNHRISFGFGLLHGLGGDQDRVLLVPISIDGHPDLFAQNLELIHRGRAVNIAGHHQDLLALGFEEQGQFAGEGCFAGSLQSRHQHHRGAVGLENQGRSFATH